MSYDYMMRNGIKRIYEEDRDTQEFYISKICEDVRGINPNVMFSLDSFFVANDEYMRAYFSHDVTSSDYDFYAATGECLWTNRLITPIKNLAGEIVGCVGFDPFRYLEAHETQDWGMNYYYYSTKKIFNKGNYLYAPEGVYNKALDEGYLILTDGFYDCVAFTSHGFLAAALLGSSLTQVIAAQLRFIDKIILAVDNDDAGMLLYKKLKKVHPNTVLLMQGVTKDADDLLKSDRFGKEQSEYLEIVRGAVKNKIPLDVKIRSRKERVKASFIL